MFWALRGCDGASVNRSRPGLLGCTGAFELSKALAPVASGCSRHKKRLICLFGSQECAVL
eukprot:3559215-Pleurochrysis_carterae.AAC.2